MLVAFFALAISAFPFIIFLDYRKKKNIHIGIIYVIVFFVNFSALWLAVQVFQFSILYALPAIFPLVFLLAWVKPPGGERMKDEQSDVLDQ